MTSVHVATFGRSDTFLPRTPFSAPEAVQRMYLLWINVREQISTPVEELTSASAPRWLTRAYKLGAEGEDEEIVFEMMSEADQLLRSGDFDTLDMVISNLKERELSLVVTEGFLRFCSRAKAHLPSWDNLKDRLLREAARRGDTEEIVFTP